MKTGYRQVAIGYRLRVTREHLPAFMLRGDF
jgi:hypothetical protein